MLERAEKPSAPASVSELLERLDTTTFDLPKRLQQCATFTRRHLHLIAISTVSDMSKACEVAPSVYVRFCQALGFSGYSEMQGLFRASYAEFRPNYKERLAQLTDDDRIETERLLADFAEAGHKSLLYMSNTVTNDMLDRIAKGMAEARMVHLVGLRRAFAVVSSMSYLLDNLGVPFNLHLGTGQLKTSSSVAEGDVLFAVTFAPFTEETLRFAKTTAMRGVPVYGLTDSEHCPMGEYAKELLIVRENEVSGFRALNASITLTTALAVALRAHRERG